MTKKNNKICNNKHTLIYGFHPAIEALKNPKRQILETYTTQAVHDNIIQKKLQLQISTNSIKIVDNSFFETILPQNTNHQGIVVKCLPLPNHDLLHYIPLLNKKEKSTIIILDQITDPQNIGSIFRSAAAFDIDLIIASKNNCPDESPTITKVACGAFEQIPFVKANLQQAINILKKHNFWSIGLDIDANENINKIREFDKIALVLGSEGKGMRNLTIKNCDLMVKIPMTNKIESLNVANTASICMFCRY